MECIDQDRELFFLGGMTLRVSDTIPKIAQRRRFLSHNDCTMPSMVVYDKVQPPSMVICILVSIHFIMDGAESRVEEYVQSGLQRSNQIATVSATYLKNTQQRDAYRSYMTPLPMRGMTPALRPLQTCPAS